MSFLKQGVAVLCVFALFSVVSKKPVVSPVFSKKNTEFRFFQTKRISYDFEWKLGKINRTCKFIVNLNFEISTQFHTANNAPHCWSSCNQPHKSTTLLLQTPSPQKIQIPSLRRWLGFFCIHRKKVVCPSKRQNGCPFCLRKSRVTFVLNDLGEHSPRWEYINFYRFPRSTCQQILERFFVVLSSSGAF